MAILLKVQTGEEELLGSLDFVRKEGSLGGIGYRTNFIRLAVPAEEFAAIGSDFDVERRERSTGYVDTLIEQFLGSDYHVVAVVHSAVVVAQCDIDFLS